MYICMYIYYAHPELKVVAYRFRRGGVFLGWWVWERDPEGEGRVGGGTT